MFLIWERYCWRQLLVTFFGTLLGFYFLFSLIDYANQMGAFRQKGIQVTWLQWILYYLFECIHRADVLIPFAVLLSSIRTLLKMNSNNELVALKCGGIPTSRILRPFILFGLTATLLLYANNEWLVPHSLAYVKLLKAAKKNKPSSTHRTPVQSIALQDGSYLLYQSYEHSDNRFYDVYWIHTDNKIIKMKYFYPDAQPPRGEFVDILAKNPEGEIALIESLPYYKLPALQLDDKTVQEAALLPELLPVSTLLDQIQWPGAILTSREALLATSFYQKISLPWLAFLAVLLTAPFCMKFSRYLPTYLIYGISIFSLVSFYLFMDALAILARRQLFDPAILLTAPVALLLFIGFWRLRTIR